MNLLAALSVADGEVYGKCRLRKRFVDFQAFLLGTVVPEALTRSVHTLALILDSSTTHAPKQLERWLQEQIKANGWVWTTVRNFLRPLRGVHKKYLSGYVAMCEFSINLNRITPSFISALVTLHWILT